MLPLTALPGISPRKAGREGAVIDAAVFSPFTGSQPGLNLLPDKPTLTACATMLATTQIGRCVNSLVTSSSVTFLVILMAACCG